MTEHKVVIVQYTGQGLGVEGLQVEFEFLAVGNEFVPKVQGVTKFDPVWVASLADIAVMKVSAYQDRDEDQDHEDLLYILREMQGGPQNKKTDLGSFFFFKGFRAELTVLRNQAHVYI